MNLSNEDIRMIKYFWEERGDLERWVSWLEKVPLFEKECPELIKAWRDYLMSKRILDIIVESLEEEQCQKN